MEKIRKRKFWSTDLLTQSDRNSIKCCMFQQYFGWFLVLIILILFAFTPVSHPEIMFKRHWSGYTKFVYKIVFLVSCICGYFVGNTSEAYYTYIILHSHFQIKMIAASIRRELNIYENISDMEKVYLKSYQKAVKKIIVRSVRHYYTIKRFSLNIIVILYLHH